MPRKFIDRSLRQAVNFLVFSLILSCLSLFNFELPAHAAGCSVGSFTNSTPPTDPYTGVAVPLAAAPGDTLNFTGGITLPASVDVTFTGGAVVSAVTTAGSSSFSVIVPSNAQTGPVSVADTSIPPAITCTSTQTLYVWKSRTEPWVMPNGHLNVTLSDLKFILDQIKIGEAHSARTANAISTTPGALASVQPFKDLCLTLADIQTAAAARPTGLSNQYTWGAGATTVPWGVREVSGHCNNIVPPTTPNTASPNAGWGSADNNFPRYVPLSSNPVTPLTSAYKTSKGTGVTNLGQISVRDPNPRIISQLISDQTSANPAAVAAARETQNILSNCQVNCQSTTPGFEYAANATTGVVTKPLQIGNITPDFGGSAGYNSWFTLFGQFFDHGLDLIPKAQSSVLIPLGVTDPIYAKSQTNPNFMVLSRGSNPATGEAMNITTPYIDQSQTYGSHASQNFFLREYSFAANTGIPTATGRLVEGTDDSYVAASSAASAGAVGLGTQGGAQHTTTWNPTNGGLYGTPNGGMATWRDIKSQTSLLGFSLTDYDVVSVPVIATDQYGKFIPGPNKFPMMLFTDGTKTNYKWIEGNPTTPISTTQPGGWTAVSSGHAFINDTENAGVPFAGPTPMTPDADSIAGDPNKYDGLYYDNEVLDQHFVAGDGRINENIGLASIHEIFHSEHNLVVGDIQNMLQNDPEITPAFFSEWASGTKVSPAWNGQRLYQAGRFVMEMEYQHMVFDEFVRRILPASFFPQFTYDPTVNGDVTQEFASAVYRLGHSMLNETIARSNPGYTYEPNNNQDVSLIQGFTNPVQFRTIRPSHIVSATFAAGKITYVLDSKEPVPSAGSIISVTGLEPAYNISNGIVDSTPVADSFSITNYYPGGTTATATAIVPPSPTTSVIAPARLDGGNGPFPGIVSVTDPGSTAGKLNFDYTPAAAAASVAQGMSAQHGNEIDEFMTDGVRNNLLGLPLDLASLNITRGREVGLPTLNQFRKYLSSGAPTITDSNGQISSTKLSALAPYTSWLQFGSALRHPQSLANFIAAYGTGLPSLDNLVTISADIDTATAVTTTGSKSITFHWNTLATSELPYAGEALKVTGMTDTTFNGDFVVASVDSTAQTFTVAQQLVVSDAPLGTTVNPNTPANMIPVAPANTTSAGTGTIQRGQNADELRAAGLSIAPAVITGATAGSDLTSIIFNGTNGFIIGDVVTVRGISSSAYNVSGTVSAADSGSFTLQVTSNYSAKTAGPVALAAAGASAYGAIGQASLTSDLDPSSDVYKFLHSTGKFAPVSRNQITGLDAIDLWVGGLAENPAKAPTPSPMLGPTFQDVFYDQMLRLQNGDRFYYLHRMAGMNLGQEIPAQKFDDIILRNTQSPNSGYTGDAGATGLLLNGSHASGVFGMPNTGFANNDCLITLDTTVPFALAGNSGANTILPAGCQSFSVDATNHVLNHASGVNPLDNVIIVADQYPLAAVGDTLTSGAGDDTIWGGPLGDTLTGLLGTDTIDGRAGNDIVNGGPGDNLLKGGPGDDVILVGNGSADVVDGGSGQDFLNASGSGDEQVGSFIGESGDDFLVGATTNTAVMQGGNGNDWLQGATDLSTTATVISLLDGDLGPNAGAISALDGGADVLVGGNGLMTLSGEGGDDIFIAGTKTPAIYAGGTGFDWIEYEYNVASATDRGAQYPWLDPAGFSLTPPLTPNGPDAASVQGFSGTNSSTMPDTFFTNNAPDRVITSGISLVPGTLDLKLNELFQNNIQAGEWISGPGIAPNTRVVGAAADPSNSFTLISLTIEPTTPTVTASSTTPIYISNDPLVHPELIAGLPALLTGTPGWNKSYSVTTSGATSAGATVVGLVRQEPRALGATVLNGAAPLGTVIAVYGNSVELDSPLPALASGTSLTFNTNGQWSGGDIVLLGGGSSLDSATSLSGNNYIDGAAMLHVCILVKGHTLANDPLQPDPTKSVPCGNGDYSAAPTSFGFSTLTPLVSALSNGTIKSSDLTTVREAWKTIGVNTTLGSITYLDASTSTTITPVPATGVVDHYLVTKADKTQDFVRNISSLIFQGDNKTITLSYTNGGTVGTPAPPAGGGGGGGGGGAPAAISKTQSALPIVAGQNIAVADNATDFKFFIQTPGPGTTLNPILVTIFQATVPSSSMVQLKSLASAKDSADGFPTVEMTVQDALGKPTTTFARPLKIDMGATDPTGSVVYSNDGVTWQSVPKIPSNAPLDTLPDGMPLGYYVTTDGYTIIMTTHLTQFAVRLQPKPLSITTQSQKLGISQSAAVSFTGGVAGGAIAVTTTTPAVCTVTADGNVTGKAVGQCDLKAVQPASGRYLSSNSNLYSIEIVAAGVSTKAPTTFIQLVTTGKNKYLATFNFGVKYANKSISVSSLAPMTSLPKLLKVMKLDKKGMGRLVVAGAKGGSIQVASGKLLLGAQVIK